MLERERTDFVHSASLDAVLPKATVSALRWYEDNSNTIQFVLLALMAAVVIIFRKRIRWDGQR